MVVVDMHESSDQINLQTLKQYPARQPTNETRKTDMHRLDIEYLKSGNLYTCKSPTIDIAQTHTPNLAPHEASQEPEGRVHSL